MLTISNYRFDIDLLKGVCILAVFFYHVGWLATGYLGVDAFFVINGFLIVPGLLAKTQDSQFSYLEYIMKRVMRLWPLTLLASTLVLCLGFTGMLPDDFENLSQAVVASNFFAENILSAITTKNYWDPVNDYKPLMHLWYIGILIEFYVLFPLFLLIIRRISVWRKQEYTRWAVGAIWVLSLLSLIAYLLPQIQADDKFYHLPFRLFEILSGGLAGYYTQKRGKAFFSTCVNRVMIAVLLLLLCSSLYASKNSGEIQPLTGLYDTDMMIPRQILMLFVILCTNVFLLSQPLQGKVERHFSFKGIALLGKMSFSVFIWHQVLLALSRYFVYDQVTPLFVLCLLIIVILLSALTYWGVEQKIKPTWKNFSYTSIFAILITVPAVWVYLNAGVVRDVPELNVSKEEKHRGMFAEYCDRIYAYDKDFSDSSRIKVLVAGVSFGRDFANILLESGWRDSIEISYVFKHDARYSKRYKECDYLFTFTRRPDVPDYVWNLLKKDATVYGIGIKNFGTCNGLVYQRRNSPDYFEQSVTIHPNFYLLNDQWKKEWGADHYIDYIRMSTLKDGKIRVFTDDHKFISQDCRHLTQSGAQWFSRIIDWTRIFGNKEK